MTKKIKKSLLAVSVLATVCSVSGAVVALDPAQGVNASASSVSLLDFETNFGASVRVSDPTGIRFKLKLSQAKKDEIFGSTGKTLGMFIFPKSKAFVGDCDYSKLTQKINIVFEETDLYKKDGFWYANGVSAEMFIQNYDLEFIAVGYIKTGETYEYSDISIEDNARSIAYVAARAYKAGEATAKMAEIIEKSVYAGYGITETRTAGDNKNEYRLTDTNTQDTWTSYVAMKEALPITLAVDENVQVMQGESVQLTPSFVVNEKVVDLAELPFTYTVSSENLVCDKDGVVKGVTAGTAEITVKMGAFTATQTVTVTDEKYEKLADVTYYANKNATLSINLSAQNLTSITSLTIGGDVYAESEYTFDGTTLTVAKATMEGKNAEGGNKAIEILGTTEAGVKVTVAGVIDYVNYALSTKEDFVNFQGMYKASKAYDNIYTKVVLTNNINLGGVSMNYGASAGTFYGILDGQGYTVSNFNVTSNSMFWRIGQEFAGCKTTEFKNIGFIIAQRTTTNHGGVLALAISRAEFNNVYLQATNTSTDNLTAGFADYAYGQHDATFKNCFVNYNSAAAFRGALVSRAIDSPYFENCYALSNNAMGIYTNGEVNVQGVTVTTNCYATEQAFKSAVTALPKGFDPAYWTMQNGMLTFKSTVGEWRTIEGEQFVAGNKSQSLVLDLGADVTNVSSVTIGGTAVANYSLANGKLTIPFASITARGDVEVYVNATTANSAVMVNAKAKVVDYAIGTVDEFISFANTYATSTANDSVYKYAVLTDNIDMTGKTLADRTANARFYGTFDGQGYTINGLHVNSYLAHTIGNPSGQQSQFKNVALINATRNASTAGGMLAFTIENALIENVYIQGKQIGTTTQASNGNNPGYTGALSDYAYNTATIRSCFVQFETEGHLKMAGALVSRADTATVIEDCYAISSSAVNLYGKYLDANTHGYANITANGYKLNLYESEDVYTEKVANLPNAFDSTLWATEDGIPMFKSATVIEIAEEKVVAYNRASQNALVLDLGAYGIEQVNSVVVGTTRINSYTYANGKLTVANTDMQKGQSAVSVTAKTATDSLFVSAKVYVVDYAIGNATELNAYRDACKGAPNKETYVYAALTANIDYENNEYYSANDNSEYAFFGSFDGRGYTVSNVKVRNSFFPGITGIYNGQRAVIKNFGLVNVIKHTANGGALLANAILDTDIDNVYVKGTVDVYADTLTGAIGATVYRTNVTNTIVEIDYKNNTQAPALFGNLMEDTTSVNNIYTLMTGSESYTYHLGADLRISNHNMQYTEENFKNAITKKYVPAGFNYCWSIVDGLLTFTNAK